MKAFFLSFLFTALSTVFVSAADLDMIDHPLQEVDVLVNFLNSGTMKVGLVEHEGYAIDKDAFLKSCANVLNVNGVEEMKVALMPDNPVLRFDRPRIVNPENTDFDISLVDGNVLVTVYDAKHIKRSAIREMRKRGIKINKKATDL